jgi:hypothetical protein
MSSRKARVCPDSQRRTQKRIRPGLRGGAVNLKPALAELRDISELCEAIRMETRVLRLPWLDRLHGDFDGLDPVAMARALSRIYRQLQQRKVHAAAEPAKRRGLR